MPEQAQAEGNNCLDLRIWFAEVQYTPELDAQRLKLTFPQAILKHEARGYIPPEEWDNGILPFLLIMIFLATVIVETMRLIVII